MPESESQGLTGGCASRKKVFPSDWLTRMAIRSPGEKAMLRAIGKE